MSDKKSRYKKTKIGQIPQDWDKCAMGSLFSVNTGKRIGRIKNATYPIEGASGRYGQTNKFLVNGAAVLLGRVGTLGNIRFKEGKFWVSDNTFYIQSENRNKLLFLYYYLKTFDFSKLNVGSTQPLVRQSDLKNIRISVPEISEQKRIVAVLSSLDQKIELNREMNETLEEIGKAIFKHWLIDFEFPWNSEKNEFDLNGKAYKSSGGKMKDSDLGKIPEMWEVKKLDDVCKFITNGGTPRRAIDEYWEGGTINWFKTGELNDTVLLDSEEKMTEAGLKNSSAKKMPPNSVVVAIYASPTVGRLGILRKGGTTNQACTGLVADDNKCSFTHLYYWLLFNKNYYNRISRGAAQQNISKGIIVNTKIAVPGSMGIIKNSGLIFETIWDQIALKEIQNYRLAKIRDLLLPRLMSGRLRIN